MSVLNKSLNSESEENSLYTLFNETSFSAKGNEIPKTQTQKLTVEERLNRLEEYNRVNNCGFQFARWFTIICFFIGILSIPICIGLKNQVQK